MTDKRESVRLKADNSRRILDPATRKRRQKKALDALEQDNYHDDPHANLVMHKKAPKFEESLLADKTNNNRRRNKGRSDLFKQRFRKNFATLIEEEQSTDGSSSAASSAQQLQPNYFTSVAPPSRFPERKFCAVCGFPSSYTCLHCGTRYCCVRCLNTHQDTRCLKWTA